MQTMIIWSARRPNIKMQRLGSQACLLDAQSNFPPLILSVRPFLSGTLDSNYIN